MPNMDYLRAAMAQEVQHANLLRAAANLGADATTDPYQTFFFPANTSATPSTVPDGPYGGPYGAAQLDYFAHAAASIMGVEAEHRVLGQVILNANQPNDRSYEQTDGLLTDAMANAAALGLPSSPSYVPASLTASRNPIPVSGGAFVGMTIISWDAPSVTYTSGRSGRRPVYRR
jgi:hypothetical protein